MSQNRRIGLLLIGIGVAFLLYGSWALRSGYTISTWARVEYSWNLPYWITVVTFLALGVGNMYCGIKFLRGA